MTGAGKPSVLAASPHINFVEVSPRDGLQNEPVRLETATKVDLILKAEAAGMRRIEVTGFAKPDVVPALADAEAVVLALPGTANVEYSALVANLRGYHRAVSTGLTALNMVVLVTDEFSQRNQRLTTREAVAEAEKIAEAARCENIRLTVTLGAAFGCPFEGEVPISRLRGVARQIAGLGPDELCLADTIGVATPRDVVERFSMLTDVAPNVTRRAHFHDTRNTGIANALAAIDLGITELDTSLGGVGGCPFAPAATGNLATEDLLYCLDRMQVQTWLDLPRVIEAATWLRSRLNGAGSGHVSLAGGFP